jgi:hypothetical protein
MTSDDARWFFVKRTDGEYEIAQAGSAEVRTELEKQYGPGYKSRQEMFAIASHHARRVNGKTEFYLDKQSEYDRLFKELETGKAVKRNKESRRKE